MIVSVEAESLDSRGPLSILSRVKQGNGWGRYLSKGETGKEITSDR